MDRRQKGELNWDGKTQTKTELARQRDKDQRVRDVAVDFTYRPWPAAPTATSTHGPFNIPFSSLSFINTYPWNSFRNLITHLYLRPFGFPTEPSSNKTITTKHPHSQPTATDHKTRFTLYSRILTCVAGIPPFFWFGSDNLLQSDTNPSRGTSCSGSTPWSRTEVCSQQL
jgi:hypothetical protein